MKTSLAPREYPTVIMRKILKFFFGRVETLTTVITVESEFYLLHYWPYIFEFQWTELIVFEKIVKIQFQHFKNNARMARKRLARVP